MYILSEYQIICVMFLLFIFGLYILNDRLIEIENTYNKNNIKINNKFNKLYNDLHNIIETLDIHKYIFENDCTEKNNEILILKKKIIELSNDINNVVYTIEQHNKNE